MYIEIDFQSDEALYLQLRNQIILGIANSLLHEGDALPPVRQMAGEIGINMHTVNKAYALLRQEGIVSIDRRRGTVICVDVDGARALEEARSGMEKVLAKASCHGLDREQMHQLVDEICDGWGM